jgi:hypothetical protein
MATANRATAPFADADLRAYSRGFAVPLLAAAVLAVLLALAASLAPAA